MEQIRLFRRRFLPDEVKELNKKRKKYEEKLD